MLFFFSPFCIRYCLKLNCFFSHLFAASHFLFEINCSRRAMLLPVIFSLFRAVPGDLFEKHFGITFFREFCSGYPPDMNYCFRQNSIISKAPFRL